MIVDTQREKYQAVEEPNYLVCDRGWRSWAFTLDHKRIGVMYLAGILICFLLGGVMALLIRLELFTPGKAFLSEDRYNEIFVELAAFYDEHDVSNRLECLKPSFVENKLGYKLRTNAGRARAMIPFA